jgi:hypothetical protein
MKKICITIGEKPDTLSVTAFIIYAGAQPQKNTANMKIICFNK